MLEIAALEDIFTVSFMHLKLWRKHKEEEGWRKQGRSLTAQ